VLKGEQNAQRAAVARSPPGIIGSRWRIATRNGAHAQRAGAARTDRDSWVQHFRSCSRTSDVECVKNSREKRMAAGIVPAENERGEHRSSVDPPTTRSNGKHQ
jgi:hypothetical protein